MEEGQIIRKTLNGLKQRLNSDRTLTVQQEAGAIFELSCSFHNQATIEQLENFQSEHNWILPKDYQVFLLEHNGARIFEDLDLYSLEELITFKDTNLPEGCFCIASFLDSRIVIDSRLYQKGIKDYLFCLDSIAGFENAINLNANFEL
ncbi:SMI1/KNR4 family protein [Gracilibacillus kekensis]|uniref:SMI1 / KNR4 family (SUKH-1) n=1 Tax=Gracilibacillus kekensis TaxID=1027249 RepID=A0A1M7IWA4_9BACI|nr:SMI1/KNR4 family protein [Gracilibacillus kekensis]SHM45006.1 SMI1 / KNR4 family (SUKH-1) [Gracilibacillus kekensis]